MEPKYIGLTTIKLRFFFDLGIHPNACSKSAIRSSVSSIPSEMRAKPSLTGSPQRARRSTELDAAEARRRDQQRAAFHQRVYRPASSNSTATSPPKRFICRVAI